MCPAESTKVESPLIRGLQNAAAYDHPVAEIALVETHISWVLLTGEFAYKVKKPVTLPFADFSTLERRRFLCEEELRLNRRLAPSLYLSVVPIAGSPEQPEMNGSSEPMEYAVKMRQFSQDMLLSRLIQHGGLLPSDIDGLAEETADFHGRVDVAAGETTHGSPEVIREYMEGNFRSLMEDVEDAELRTRLMAMRDWSESEWGRLKPVFIERQRNSFVRECHGDLHLGNMILHSDRDERRVVLFDGIEFNADLRWIDVMSDAAFCIMDLADRGRRDFAHRFLNAYLENTGDYAGLDLLSFYLVYRALVRAKVAGIRLHQTGLGPEESHRQLGKLISYLDLAETYTQRETPQLIITHGLSGSGKTRGTQPVLESLGALRLRSDVWRKRIGGLEPLASSHSRLEADLYSPEMTAGTYRKLEQLADAILRAGFSVIVDATFLLRRQRDAFRDLALRRDVPFRILSFQASRAILERRVRSRGGDASEATAAVLEYQFQHVEPLENDEVELAEVINTETL